MEDEMPISNKNLPITRGGFTQFVTNFRKTYGNTLNDLMRVVKGGIFKKMNIGKK